jgi:hypothetical protein
MDKLPVLGILTWLAINIWDDIHKATELVEVFVGTGFFVLVVTVMWLIVFDVIGID